MARTFHLDFTEDGLEGQWADIVNVGLKSPKQFANLTQAASDAGKGLVAMAVTAWNVRNPETDEAIPVPDSPDLDINDVPMIIQKRIADNIQDQLAAVLPKASAFGKS